jgi:PAS domain S-box-containing protein
MDPIDQKSADADIAELLAQSPFAGHLRGGVPLLIAAGQPARIVFANEAAKATFRTLSLAQFNTAAIAGTSPGARRLRQLANGLSAVAPPRLERLRFFVGRLPLELSMLCAGVANARGEVFLVAAQPAGAQDMTAPTAMPPTVASAIALRDEIDGKGNAARRFLWSLDQHSRFASPASALVGSVGEAAPRPTESLAALKARTGLDEDGQLAGALASRGSFSSLRVAWPRDRSQDSSQEAAVVALSGAPIFDRERRFLGYRGFGVFTGETAPFETTRLGGAESDDAPSAPSLDQPAEMAPSLASADSSPALDTPPVSGDARVSAEAPTERSAEIVPLRSPVQTYAGGPNVVPIRPGALRPFLAADEGPRRGDDNEGVELTIHERDAFREIARALGAKATEHREERNAPASAGPDAFAPAALDQTRDLIDLGAPHAAAPATGNGEEPIVVDDAASAVADRIAHDSGRLLDLLPIGALVARGGEALYLNRTLLELLGYRDLAQFRARSGLTQTFKGRPPEHIGAAGESGALLLNSADGEEIAVDGQIQTIEWGGAVATLISLRRSLEAEFAPRFRALEFDARAQQAEARELSSVLDTATDGIVMLDSQGRILSLNRPAEALFGFDQNEVAGENFLTLLSPESHAPIKAYFDGLQTSGLASLLNDGREALGRERHGRAIPLFITMGRVNSSPDAKFCAVLRDMTQWKTIERDLEAARGQAEKASALKSEFLAKIGHEIRTPLNAILGFAEVILDERFGPVGNDRYKEYLKDIHSSGAHVMSLVNDLLDLSKIEAGKHDFNFAAVDANSVIQECVSLMQPQAAQERIIMRLSLSDKLPKIIADERSLRQIMLNLMSNAVKFNEPGGQVIVSTAMNDSGQAVIRVRDTGIGMSEAELGAALEPFRQISSAKQKGGTGLGLPLTKALVEANRAGISIKSRKEQGTLVEVVFPTTQAAAAQ